MAKNRSYGDRGTGYTPRKQSIPGTSNEKRFGRTLCDSSLRKGFF